MPNLPSDVIDAALNAHQRQADERMAASLEQQAAPVRQQLFNAQVPDLNGLLQGLNPMGASAQPQAAQAPQQPSFGFQMPSLNDLLGDLAPKPQQPVATPLGTPAAMPQAPGLVPATITAGPRPDQQLRPGESVGSVTLQQGPKPKADGDYRAYARQVAQQYGLDPDIFERQINQESGFQPWGPDGKPLGSPAGAQGIAQFMPATAAGYGVDVNDPYSSLDGAARHMRDLLKSNNGNYRFALAAYNAGQGNVDKWGEGVFDDDFAAGQTRDYVNIILGPGSARPARQSMSNAGAGVSPAASAAPTASPGVPPAGAGPDTLMMRQSIEPADDMPQGDVERDPRRFIPTPNIVPLGPALRGQDTLDDAQYGSARGQNVNPNDPVLPHIVTAPARPYTAPGTRNRAVPGDVVEWQDVPEPQPYGPFDPAERNRAVPGGPVEWTEPPNQGGRYPNIINDQQSNVPPVLYDENGNPYTQTPQGGYQAATGRSGGSGVMHRGPLGSAPQEVGNDEYIDPDSGPREAIPGSVGASPVQPYGPPLSEAGPEQPDYSYTLADGRTEPPTSQGDWIPTRTIPNPQRPPVVDPGQWLAEDSQSTPPMSIAEQNRARRIVQPEDQPLILGDGSASPPTGYQPPTLTDAEALQRQGPVGRAIDAGSQMVGDAYTRAREINPGLPPINPAGMQAAVTSPEARSLLTTDQPDTIPELWDWRGKVAKGAADAIAHGLGENPDQVIVGVEINGVPVQMTVSDLLQNFTDPLLAAGWGVGDIVLDAVGRKAMQVVYPFLRGVARETVGRLLTSEPVQAGGRAVGEAGQRVTSALDANAERVAAADARMASQGSTIAPVGPGFGPDSGRMYHGTGGQFDRPTTFDNEALFGPGYYLTSDPRVAGSYAEGSQNSITGRVSNQTRIRRLQDEASSLEREVARISDPAERVEWQAALDAKRADIDRLERSGPNVRAVDVPEDIRILDAERPLTPDEMASIRATLTDPVDIRLFDAERARFDDPNDLSAVRSALDKVATGYRERTGNKWLAQAGFDGISYDGGKNIPMRDGAGQAIEHRAMMVFPESLEKVRNAFSGTRGGATFGFSPSASLVNDLGNSVGGGVFGATTGYALPADSDEERRQNALRGAAVGMVAGPVAGRAMRASGGALATPGVSPQATARNEAMVNVWSRGPRKAPDSSIPWRTRLTAALSDDLAPFAHMEREAEQRSGRALTDDEKISVLARINPDGAAQQRLQQNVAPAVRELQQAGGNVNDLNLGLMLTHNIDVADEMGRRAYEAAKAAGKSDSEAARLADLAANDRKFFGGTGRAEMVEQLETLQARIVSDGGEDAVRAYDAAVDRIWQHQRETLERMVDRGVVSRAQADDLLERYPHYIKTYVLDFDDPGASVANAGGRGVSLRQSPVKALTVKGSDREVLSPLESIVKRTIEAERAAHKNAIYNAFLNLIDEDDTLRRSVTTSRVTGTKQITGFVDGERQTMRIARPLADVLERPGQGPHIPILSDILNWWKGAITSRNPGFALVVSPMRDAADFAVRQSAVEGGPQMIGRVTQAYAEQMKQAFGDIVSGRALRGEMTGDAQRFMEAGGFSGRLNTTEKGIHQIAREITRGGGAPIDSQAAKDILKDSLTFGWAEKLGNRLEQVPRAAAMRLAEQRGAKPTTAMLAGRDATIDFQRGGWLIRYANTIIPFLNPTVQSTAQLTRLLRDHPKTAVATIGALVGGPAMAAEAYNRADEQRARAYSDVPDYIKDTGVVIMLPWAGSDERGERPNYLWYPLGVFAPFAMMAREAIARPLAAAGMGPESQRTAGELLTSMLTAYSPIKGESAGSVLSSVVPPGVSTGIELSQNKDFFRNRTISTDRADENASSLAHGISGVLNTVGRATRGFPGTGGLEEATPSQVDYAIRSDTGIYGQTARAASDLATGKTRRENRPIQNAPVVGGIAGRIIRDQGGARIERLVDPDVMVSPLVERALESAGMKRSDISPMRIELQGVKLKRGEQERAQRLFNSYLREEVAAARDRSAWGGTRADRKSAMEDAISRARSRASAEVLQVVDPERRAAGRSR